MKNMKETNFAVQLPLYGKDIQDLRNLMLEFLKNKVKKSVVANYIPITKGDIEKHTPVSLGILIGNTVEPGDPTDEDLTKLLDLIKEFKADHRLDLNAERIRILFPI